MSGPKRRPLRLCFHTWNVGGAAGAVGGLEALLRPDGRCDLLCLALQEVVDINDAATYVRCALDGVRSIGQASADGLAEPLSAETAPWEARARALLPGHALLARRQSVGLLLLVFVAHEHAPHCRARVGAIGTGPLGAGNKGAVAASLAAYGSSVAVVNAHLQAGSKAAQARSREAEHIHAALEWTRADGSPEAPPCDTRLVEHDFVVFGGDLNFRLALPDAEVRTLAAGGAADLEVLGRSDELRSEQRAGRALAGYAEGALDFAPTYKYDVGSTEYDTGPKRRAPAWCDRVLWRDSPHARAVAYGRRELTESDHRPVSAVLELSVLDGAEATRAAAALPVGALCAEGCGWVAQRLRGCLGEAPPSGYQPLRGDLK